MLQGWPTHRWPGSPVIDVQHLSKSYGGTHAVRDLSFSVARGEVLGLLGPNGAGKSTTMRIITGYLRPTSGTVRVAGTVVDDSDVFKQSIGYLPEFSPLYGDMIVYDLLQFAAAAHGVPRPERRDRFRRLSSQCGLETLMHRPFDQLSRGYKQRAGLAYALVGDPEILILDEPTSGLDPNQIVEIRSVIKEIGQSRTVIFSTHILAEAESTCDRIVIINDGRLVADGTADQVKDAAAPGMAIRVTLRGTSAAEATAAFEQLGPVDRVLVDDANQESGEVSLLLACRSDVREAVPVLLAPRGWTLLEMTRATESLEEVFQRLTQKRPR